jgi:cytochrome c-type biogenesis protein CcsB
MGKSLIYSYKTAIALLIVYALGLAIATFIEKYMGTEAAKLLIYYSPVFFFLQLLLIINFVAASLHHRLFKKKKGGFLLIHTALIVILAGALVTHLFGKEGIIHLREGENTDFMLIQTNKGESRHPLPFSLELKKFTITRYPGSASPSSFESAVVIHSDNQSYEKKIAMNRVLDWKGYRLFQSSYDKDEQGTILSVNKDGAGRDITYAGYVLLVTGFLLCFTGKNSRFRRLARLLKQMSISPSMITIFILSFFAISVCAQDYSPEKISEIVMRNQINPEHAALFGALPVQSRDGRLEPVNTFSSEALRKLHHSETIGELNSDQFLLSLLVMPDMWMHIPFIYLRNEAIARHYGLSEKQCAYIELFDDQDNYKLLNDLNLIYSKPSSQRSRYEKDLIQLDEQVNIFYQLIQGEMLAIFPVENAENDQWQASHELLDEYINKLWEGLQSGDWKEANRTLDSIRAYQKTHSTLTINDQKIKAELSYNRQNIFNQCKKLYLIPGGLLLVLAFISLFRQPGKRMKWPTRLLCVIISAGLLYHLFGMSMRGYIAGYAPWSNAYETMIYVSFVTVLAGIVFVRRSLLTFALATLFGGIILFVAGLNWMDPQISSLVPVLKSPWLMIHVAVNVAAYGFFGIGFLLGISNLLLLLVNRSDERLNLSIRKLSVVNEMALLAGLALMTTGTFMGAVWANETWGRYWGWDPKETWALVTIVVYTITTHIHLIKKGNYTLLLNIMSVLAFASVLMTYFGVNYFLSGMHSYGQ